MNFMKLSTKELKEIISVKLNTVAVKQAVLHAFPECTDDEFDQFKNGSKWSRVEKKKLKDEVGDYFILKNNSELEFNPDVSHECDLSLAKELLDTKELEKCFIRTFIPKNEFQDYFRMEIVTDPTDSKIVSWNLIID